MLTFDTTMSGSQSVRVVRFTSAFCEAKSARIADRPQFRDMIDEGGKAATPSW